MANEIKIQATSGLTLKALIVSEAGTIWDNIAGALVVTNSLSDVEWTAGLLDMVEEQSSDGTKTGLYVYATWPAALTQDARYTVVFFSGASPSPGDLVFGKQDDPTYDVSETVDGLLDEVNTGATHNVNSSVGKQIRQSSESTVITSGTAQGPGANSNQIQLAAGASAVDGAYDPALVVIVGGTGSGQCRLILEYDGGTTTATVDRTWKMNPDVTSEYLILANPGREHINEGLCQAGSTSTTVKLNTLGSSTDDAYNGQIVFLRSGTGEDQARLVIDYNGTTKVATVDRAWDTTPDATTAYVMLPHGNSNIAAINLSSIAAIRLALSAATIVTGAAEAGTLSTTAMSTDLTEATTNHYKDRIIIWTSGVLKDQATAITSYTPSGGVLGFEAITDIPSAADTFIIV